MVVSTLQKNAGLQPSMLCRKLCGWIAEVSPKIKIFWENTNLGTSVGKPAASIASCFIASLFWEATYSWPVCPLLQEGGEHSRQVNTGRCLVSQGSACWQEQSPAGADKAGEESQMQACSGRGLAGTGQERKGHRDTPPC